MNEIKSHKPYLRHYYIINYKITRKKKVNKINAYLPINLCHGENMS